MAADKLYLWSPIPKVIDENAGGVVRDYYNVGEQVTQADLGIADAEWEYLKSAGTLRDQAYPKPLAENPSDPRSPAEYYRGILTRAGEGRATDEELKELSNMGTALTPDGFTPTSTLPLAAGVEVPQDVAASQPASGGSATGTGSKG